MKDEFKKHCIESSPRCREDQENNLNEGSSYIFLKELFPYLDHSLMSPSDILRQKIEKMAARYRYHTQFLWK